MIRLALETSTLTQTVALFDDDALVDHTRVVLRGGHSRVLYNTLVATLERHGVTWDRLDALVIGVGPGSFTGLRIGLSLGKGIAFAHGLPIIPVPSLDSVAPLLPPGAPVAVAVDARMREVYATCLSTTAPWDSIVAVDAWRPADFARAMGAAADGGSLVGNGFATYADAFADLGGTWTAPGPTVTGPDAAGLVPIALARGIEPCEPDAVEPCYIRASEAELKR